MFSAVPRRYDIINRIFTLRLDERWRRMAAEKILEAGPAVVLDLCTGTGDLSLALDARGGRSAVIGADFSLPMLAEARRKAGRAGSNALFVAADAGELPFRDAAFGAVGIAFGFRNLTYRNPGRDRYLAEVLRVLEPGGRFVIVESSQPRSPFIRAMAHLYVTAVVLLVGGLISGERGAYRYLAHSAVNFPGPDGVAALLRGAGFSRVEYRRLFLGAAAIHVAYR
ncbi:MAG: ubiquinone/menaquinone biosynthesis methyltransferase [Spirochaetes bacterium]|nr:ubiquinone/menaquinone biosynthesis methyltransferase [Spirochaetota bacterium]